MAWRLSPRKDTAAAIMAPSQKRQTRLVGHPIPAPGLPKPLEKVNLNAAGIDCGSAEHDVAVPDDRDPQPVRQFGSFTADLIALADGLEQCGLDTVAMAATGVSWSPLDERLAVRGFDVKLVEPSTVKGLSGRKTDVLNCQWIQPLHTFGL